MSDDKEQKRVISCKFVDPGDKDQRNEVLFKESETVEQWQASIERCMEIVEERMDAIERRILEAAAKKDGA